MCIFCTEVQTPKNGLSVTLHAYNTGQISFWRLVYYGVLSNPLKRSLWFKHLTFKIMLTKTKSVTPWFRTWMWNEYKSIYCYILCPQFDWCVFGNISKKIKIAVCHTYKIIECLQPWLLFVKHNCIIGVLYTLPCHSMGLQQCATIIRLSNVCSLDYYL